MKKILIIEDDSLLVKVYEEVLKKHGYEVITASTGPMGIVLTKSKKPDLVLLDVMIPGGMNGFDILTEIKTFEDLKHIPVIVISNLDSEKRTAMSMGAVDYIFKATTSLDDIVRKIKDHLPPEDHPNEG